jgi:hypothetical protein
MSAIKALSFHIVLLPNALVILGLAIDFSFFVGVDCGVFTCMFCDFILNDCLLVFNQDHIDQCRNRITISIMKNCAIE